ncbi:hypothetical protein TcarDRAFT_0763 [Thermosinus carboxydivorans Nor1]|uniref:DUF6922 domain-containing protein n=2 Tax=Thermosinus TaxID=261684 RepID=A1HT33_9FIRM|nr:hypothetical protein TcarDRAFT_0763 [Thermosinus carboxydivorans Nor1]
MRAGRDMAVDGARLPERLKRLFWDVDFASVDCCLHRDFIIERVLNMGDMDDLLWLWRTFTATEICQVVRTSRRLTKKTARCWQAFFGLAEEEMACIGRYSTQLDGIY